MRLDIEKFAKIEKANVVIDGITVIAGENNAGKSTIGKILFCLYSIFKDIDKKVVDEKKHAVIRSLFNSNKIRDMIFSYNSMKEMYPVLEIADILLKLDDEDSIRNFLKKENIELTEKEEKELFEIIKYDDERVVSLLVKKYFGNEFNNQYLPLSGDVGETKLNLHIKGEDNSVRMTKDSIYVNSGLNLIKDCIYIDNPLAIDDIDNIGFSGGRDIHVLEYVLSGNLICRHDQLLRKKLCKSLKNENNSLINDDLLEQRLQSFKAKIISLIQGDFVEKENKFVFLDSTIKKEIEIENLSTGIKSFAILLKLIENRDITYSSMIVLDEPEIHLHPMWQLKFAEILVLLQREFNLNIVITSHSPYFINAIEIYSEKYKITEKCNYYLASLNSKNNSLFENVTEDTSPIYDKLAAPFDELDDIINEVD